MLVRKCIYNPRNGLLRRNRLFSTSLRKYNPRNEIFYHKYIFDQFVHVQLEKWNEYVQIRTVIQKLAVQIILPKVKQNPLFIWLRLLKKIQCFFSLDFTKIAVKLILHSKENPMFVCLRLLNKIQCLFALDFTKNSWTINIVLKRKTDAYLP